ncbi:unnamed protein product [Lymnaea stagnalis]|uniref:Nuclear pore complex protein n=1 Tax=Lymnaea stagnalis TaxID=6523 RepID=A0AAV2HX84_LYMST
MEGRSPSYESYLQHGDALNPRAGETAKIFKRRSSNVILQKSIQLLDEAVSPYVNRASRTPRTFRNAPFSPIRHDSKSEPDASLFYFTPAKKPAPVQSPDFDNSSVRGGSLLHVSSRVTFPVDEATSEQDLTELNTKTVAFIAEDDPGKKASEGLYSAFKESLKDHPTPQQIFELLTDYESHCSKNLLKIQHLSRGVTRNQPKYVLLTMNTHEVLQHEKNTWKLVNSLYKDRLDTEAREDNLGLDDEDDDLQLSTKTSVWALSEKNIANHLFEKESLVRQSQLVIDWLETCTLENIDTFTKNAKFFMDQPVAWENTLHNLQKSKQDHRLGSGRFITEMDPDAPHRQGKPLDDLDQEDETFFIEHLFICLRAGQLEKAQELCHRFGQPWRAATLEGWRLLHDPNYYGTSLKSDVALVEGNPYRDVWKRVCWQMASEGDMNRHERAVYATLSGNLHGLLPVCSTWMDYVWAYFKVMVDVRVEQEIRLHFRTPRNLDSLPEKFTEALLEPQDIFNEISARIEENIRIQSEISYHVIQKCIILGDISGLIEVMYRLLQKDREPVSGHLLRFMAHIVLFLKTIGKDCKEELCEAILKAYVEELIRNKHTSLVAHYVAELNPTDQVQLYAAFLEEIEAQEERQQCLRWAEEEGLNIALITKSVVERIRLRESASVYPVTSLAVDLTITEEDKAKIDAIEWLVFDQAHRPEAIKQANAMMRTFIAVKKHAAARQVFEKLPSDTIDIIYRLWHMKTGSNDLPADDSNAIREYMCMKAYLDAVESFNDWFSLYHQGQPLKPNGLEGGSFTDRVAFEHKMKQYQQEYDRWMHNLQVQTRTTRDRIYNVLLFTDGGWLVDAFENLDPDQSRLDQMSRLRKLHLPALCLNLHSVLHSSHFYAEAVQIADVLASEQYQLYKEFDKESLKHILIQITKSSLALLDENKDPLGYEVV